MIADTVDFHHPADKKAAGARQSSLPIRATVLGIADEVTE
jgi:hypothetical protein